MDRNTLLWQVVIGMWLAMAAYIGITARSWNAFLSFVYVAAFFTAWGGANALARSGHKALRVVGFAGRCAFSLVILGVLALGIEQLYLVNGESYPRFMAKNIGTADMHTLDRLQETTCEGRMVRVYPKANYTWVIRCGDDWFSGHTFISNADPYRELMKNSKESGE